MDKFPANSHSDKVTPKTAVPEEKVVEQVTTGVVVQRNRPLGKRFAETFFGGTAKAAGKYVIMDVLIPAAKDAISDAISQGVERMLFGEGRSSGSSRRSPFSSTNRSRGNGYVSYSSYSGGGATRRPEEPRQLSRRARETHNFKEIVLDTRAEARSVLQGMSDLIENYEVCSLSDLYKLCGIVPQFTDERWGWVNLDGVREVRIRDGRYLLDLPPPDPIEQ